MGRLEVPNWCVALRKILTLHPETPEGEFCYWWNMSAVADREMDVVQNWKDDLGGFQERQKSEWVQIV